MSRKTRIGWANGLIALAALAGGVGLTNHYVPGAFAGTGSSTGTGTGASAGSGTATSDAIQYQFGTVQLTVTKASGKITKIDFGTSTATAGRDQAFPYLVQYAIQAQGSSFNNLSGATYTTDAFKQALDNALAKLG